MERGVQQSAGAEKSTVGRAVEKGLCPVPGCVEANGEPESAGAPESQAQKQAELNNLQNPECVFSRIGYMTSYEQCGDQQCCPPEAHTPGEREQPVAAKTKFFAHGDGKKYSGPGKCVTKNRASGERNGVNLKVARYTQDQQDSGKHGETPDSAFPKPYSECLVERNAVIAERAFLHAGNDPSRQ